MITDSGNRTEFESGAVRDIQEGKGRCDLLPMHTLGLIIGDTTLCLMGDFVKSGNRFDLELAFYNMVNEYYDKNRFNASLELSKHFEEGAKKYGERNWQKGIPLSRYIDSALRHHLKYRAGQKDEPHDRAALWNILCAMWTLDHFPELDDVPHEKKKEG